MSRRPSQERSQRCGCALATLLALAPAGPILHAAPAALRVEVSRDAWLSAADAEREGNNGGAAQLKLKGIVEFFLIDFDPAPLRGKRVTRAQLQLHLSGPEALGRVTVSSVAEPWVEGRGTRYAKLAGASSFAWSRTGERRWGGAASDITSVVLGNGSSVWGFGDASPRDASGWQIVPIAPEVVKARIDGRSHGFFVMDDVGHEYTREGNTFHYLVFPNRFVASREGPRETAPHFTLWLEDEQTPASGAVSPPAAPLRNPAVARLPSAAGARLPTSAAPAVPIRDLFGEPLRALELFSARNEAIGFSVDASPDSVRVPELPGLRVSLFAMPRVGGHTDPLVPAGLRAEPPQASVASESTFIEIYVPHDARAGLHQATFRAAGQALPLSLTVWNFTLPDRLSFLPQMNCYGLPGDERAYYRLAHEHRTTLNCLGYGWGGQITRDSAPRRLPAGALDWTAWDARFGPLLDGSAFSGLPREGVPIEALYLPLNENWPMDHESHFRGGYWVESAYDDGYWRELREAALRFARHFEEQGWTEPMFEIYLNNKVYFKQQQGNRWDKGSAAWIFDEPVNTQDFWALRRFGIEFLRGVEGHPRARVVFRADISRPEWQRDLLDGVTAVEVVSGSLRSYAERVISRARRFSNLVYMYGTANAPGSSNAMPAAWCVETWALGADGVLPWQTIGRPESWKTPDPLALFYPTSAGPVPSIRLKAFRAGQQLVEYLTLYSALSGQERGSVGAAVLADASLRALSERTSPDDAGTSEFGRSASRALETLRMRLGPWLDARAPTPRERWYDPRPAPRDLSRLPEIRVSSDHP